MVATKIDKNGNIGCKKCVDCLNCYKCKECTFCTNCHNCTDCLRCTSCENCHGLEGKKGWVNNIPPRKRSEAKINLNVAPRDRGKYSAFPYHKAYHEHMDNACEHTEFTELHISTRQTEYWKQNEGIMTTLLNVVMAHLYLNAAERIMKEHGYEPDVFMERMRNIVDVSVDMHNDINKDIFLMVEGMEYPNGVYHSLLRQGAGSVLTKDDGEMEEHELEVLENHGGVLVTSEAKHGVWTLLSAATCVREEFDLKRSAEESKLSDIYQASVNMGDE